jgi:hypothetical protein
LSLWLHAKPICLSGCKENSASLFVVKMDKAVTQAMQPHDAKLFGLVFGLFELFQGGYLRKPAKTLK